MGLRSRAAVFLTLLMALFSLCALPAEAEGLDLGPYRGKVVYLDFWASWCNPCRQSFPWMNQLQEEYGPRGFVVIAVNVDHDRDLAAEFLQSNYARFKIVYDPNGAIAEKYDFKDMPTSILIGRDGNIRYVHNGFYPNKEGMYASHISTLLNEKEH